MKDFSEWHNIKHKIENFQVEKLFHDREIWWCSLGSNIGFEQDGKNAKYERPILIFRKFSKGMFWGLPLTSKEKDDIFHHKIILHLIDQNEKPQEKISEIPELTSEQIQTKLALGDDTFQKWRETDFAERAAKMKRLAEILRANAQKYGEIMTREMGKPITAARAEVEKCAWVCEYYAENAENFLSPEIAESDASESFVRFDPIGPVLAVMPWNFPFWQVLRFAAPTIMAGNVGLLKHASNVQGCAAAIEESFILAGFAQGIFQNLAIGSGAVETVIRDPRVKAITLTGSEYAGRKVAEIAGDEIKKVVLG